jgi:hypothetical protein
VVADLATSVGRALGRSTVQVWEVRQELAVVVVQDL